jgi:hypothetical protein
VKPACWMGGSSSSWSLDRDLCGWVSSVSCDLMTHEVSCIYEEESVNTSQMEVKQL